MHSGHIHPPSLFFLHHLSPPIKPPYHIHVVHLHIFILCIGKRNNIRTLWWWGDGKRLVGMSCPGTHKLTAATSTSISSAQEWVPKNSVTNGGEVNGVLPHPEVLTAAEGCLWWGHYPQRWSHWWVTPVTVDIFTPVSVWAMLANFSVQWVTKSKD